MDCFTEKSCRGLKALQTSIAEVPSGAIRLKI